MHAQYKINSRELNEAFIEQIREIFQDKDIRISINSISELEAIAQQNSYGNNGEPIYSFTASEFEEQLRKTMKLERK